MPLASTLAGLWAERAGEGGRPGHGRDLECKTPGILIPVEPTVEMHKVPVHVDHHLQRRPAAPFAQDELPGFQLALAVLHVQAIGGQELRRQPVGVTRPVLPEQGAELAEGSALEGLRYITCRDAVAVKPEHLLKGRVEHSDTSPLP